MGEVLTKIDSSLKEILSSSNNTTFESIIVLDIIPPKDSELMLDSSLTRTENRIRLVKIIQENLKNQTSFLRKEMERLNIKVLAGGETIPVLHISCTKEAFLEIIKHKQILTACFERYVE